MKSTLTESHRCFGGHLNTLYIITFENFSLTLHDFFFVRPIMPRPLTVNTFKKQKTKKMITIKTNKESKKKK